MCAKSVTDNFIFDAPSFSFGPTGDSKTHLMQRKTLLWLTRPHRVNSTVCSLEKDFCNRYWTESNYVWTDFTSRIGPVKFWLLKNRVLYVKSFTFWLQSKFLVEPEKHLESADLCQAANFLADRRTERQADGRTDRQSDRQTAFSVAWVISINIKIRLLVVYCQTLPPAVHLFKLHHKLRRNSTFAVPLNPKCSQISRLRWQNQPYLVSREKKTFSDFTSLLAVTKLISVENCDDEALIKIHTRISHEDLKDKTSY